jgi:inosine-uridine nucleoside N-ribohydrolase
VETASPVTRGITVADLLTSVDPPQANCEIAVGVDAGAFIELFLERLSGVSHGDPAAAAPTGERAT